MAPKKATTPEPAATRRSTRATSGDTVLDIAGPAKITKRTLSTKNTAVAAALAAVRKPGRPKKDGPATKSPNRPATRSPAKTKDGKEDIKPRLTALTTELNDFQRNGGEAKDIQLSLRSAFMILSEIRLTPDTLTYPKASVTALTGRWEALTGLNFVDTADDREKANNFVNDPTTVLPTTEQPATAEIRLSPRKATSPTKEKRQSVDRGSPQKSPTRSKRQTRSASPVKKSSQAMGTGRRSSILNQKGTRSRSNSASSPTSAPTRPPQAYLRGTVGSSNNEQFIPGMKDADGKLKANPFYDLMPAPPVWHRRMAPYFPFGETPYMERMMSDQINRDLANVHDGKAKRSWGDTFNDLLGRGGSPLRLGPAPDDAGAVLPNRDTHTFTSPWKLPDVDVEALKEMLGGPRTARKRAASPTKDQDLRSPARKRPASRG